MNKISYISNGIKHAYGITCDRIKHLERSLDTTNYLSDWNLLFRRLPIYNICNTSFVFFAVGDVPK